ncbi:hypothetical protein GWI33_017975 [Rhynchophorus ferrugineus]|uniref:Uncharacterized protein n=1 Tax=Rhynchophorus ferrugineus TaxID=354439 RepID=A0A834M1Z0_RHYFE|nr:hypothetical protein GWI33_017975 [Rhynchophorus ferrugineus]
MTFDILSVSQRYLVQKYTNTPLYRSEYGTKIPHDGPPQIPGREGSSTPFCKRLDFYMLILLSPSKLQEISLRKKLLHKSIHSSKKNNI